MSKEFFEEEEYCWKAIPVQYNSYIKEGEDSYSGDIFGNLTMFESPHFLWRRFHKNYIKAILLTQMDDYKLKEDKSSGEYFEMEEILNKNFSLEVLSLHNAIVSIITAVESFFREAYCAILLNVFPHKVGNRNVDEIKRYSFLNIKQIRKDFKRLCPSFNIESDENVKEVFKLRHKIVHESFYNPNYNRSQFKNDSTSVLVWAHYFDWFFADEGYWDMINFENFK